jgi:hypothetical protein
MNLKGQCPPNNVEISTLNSQYEYLKQNQKHRSDNLHDLNSITTKLHIMSSLQGACNY